MTSSREVLASQVNRSSTTGTCVWLNGKLISCRTRWARHMATMSRRRQSRPHSALVLRSTAVKHVSYCSESRATLKTSDHTAAASASSSSRLQGPADAVAMLLSATFRNGMLSAVSL